MSIRNKILFSVGCFITAATTLFISFLSYPIVTLIQDLLYDLFHCHYQLLGEATKYLLSCISSVIAVTIPLILLLLFNLLSRKAGRAEGCISPAYLFVYNGVTGVISIFTSICNMLLMRSAMDYKLFSVISVIFAVFSLFAAAAVMVVLFLIDGKRIKNLNQKVGEAIEDDSIISDTPKMFSVGRIIVLAVFIISYLIYNLICEFIVLNYLLYVLLYLFFIIICFAAVLICNLTAGKKSCENKLPFATMFVPLGAGFITSVFTNLFSAVYLFINAFVTNEFMYNSIEIYGNFYHSSAYNDVMFELSKSVSAISILLGIITIVLFTLLVFRHENKQYNAMVNGKYYGKKKEDIDLD